jgi:hypothetical protein
MERMNFALFTLLIREIPEIDAGQIMRRQAYALIPLSQEKHQWTIDIVGDQYFLTALGQAARRRQCSMRRRQALTGRITKPSRALRVQVSTSSMHAPAPPWEPSAANQMCLPGIGYRRDLAGHKIYPYGIDKYALFIDGSTSPGHQPT